MYYNNKLHETLLSELIVVEPWGRAARRSCVCRSHLLGRIIIIIISSSSSSSSSFIIITIIISSSSSRSSSSSSIIIRIISIISVSRAPGPVGRAGKLGQCPWAAELPRRSPPAKRVLGPTGT